ncbi:MAG TPA: response regulator [Burkholderiales bacterium]|nr:response regulator [Burkholderiales bacterium]
MNRDVILAVDDDEAGLYARTRVLRHAGFEVEEARTGQETLDYIERSIPALVLLDVHLPDMSGIEVCGRIKTNPRTERVPVIHISATFVTEADRKSGIEGGADVYLTEPTPPDELISIVETLLRLKRTEHALNEKLYRVGYVADNAPVLLWAGDAEGNLTYANRPWLEIAGVDSLEALQKRWIDLVHPDDRERMQKFQQEAGTSRLSHNTEFRFKRADATYRWLFCQTGPLNFSGATKGYVGSCVDITEQKISASQIARLLKVEKELSARLQRVADTALSVNSALDARSVLDLITRAAGDVIGAHQAIGMINMQAISARAVQLSELYKNWRHAAQYPHHEAIGRQVEQSNKSVRLAATALAARYSNSAQADEGLPMKGALAAPFISRAGTNIGWLQLSHRRDDSDFSAEDESTLVQLASIASVALENSRLYSELRAADRRKDEFLATLAHELRNPLAPMRNALGILQRARGDERLTREAEETLDRQLKQMVRLIDDLLDISRITRDVVDLRKSRVGLMDVIRNGVETSTPLLEAKRQYLKLSLPDETLYLNADATRLAQVFSNLLNNAAKYSPAGSTISLSVQSRAGEVLISVADTGRGIARDALARIFDMFTQVDQSSGGLGIGLTLVKRLVELHDGTVEAHSEGEGKGSRFDVRLPLIDGQRAVERPYQPTEEKKETTNGSSYRILVVDDNRDSAESLQILLSLLGNEVSVAYDGQQAVEMAESARPQVIFLDIGLPIMNGYDAARAIREQPWGRDINLIALTGWGQEDDQLRAREAGFDRHFVKPVAFESLTDVLAKMPAR